jgi:hypothetical protein
MKLNDGTWRVMTIVGFLAAHSDLGEEFQLSVHLGLLQLTFMVAGKPNAILLNRKLQVFPVFAYTN